VTWYTADLVGQLHGLGQRLPWMVLFVVVVTLVLLFGAFRSVVLPVKAVLMNLVSLGAAFGAVVFIFQEGHFANWLGHTATGFIEPGGRRARWAGWAGGPRRPVRTVPARRRRLSSPR